MKISIKRHMWLTGVLVAGLSITGCSSNGEEDLEDPLEESGEITDEAIDSAMEEMEGDPIAAEPMDDYGGAGEPLPMSEESSSEESYTSDLDGGSNPDENLANDMSGESQPLIDQLDPVSADDVESYKLEDEGPESYATVPDPMPVAEDIGSSDEEVAYESSKLVAKPKPAHSSSVSGNEVRYIAKPGDTLATIATLIYGDSNRWRDLASRNGISNPRNIYPGDVIVFDVTDESRQFANQLSQVQMESVVVADGDTLSALSQRILGDGNAWKYLWRFNEDQISNPDFITVGQVISYVPIERVSGIARSGYNQQIR